MTRHRLLSRYDSGVLRLAVSSQLLFFMISAMYNTYNTVLNAMRYSGGRAGNAT